jgi:hypothetical protein
MQDNYVDGGQLGSVSYSQVSFFPSLSFILSLAFSVFTMHFPISLALMSALLCVPSCSAAGLYTKDSAVLQVDGKSYDKLIKQSMKASVGLRYAISIALAYPFFSW